MKLSDAEAEQAIRHAELVLALKPEEIEADRKACPNGLAEIIDGILGYLKQAPRIGMSVRIVKLTMLRNSLSQAELI